MGNIKKNAGLDFNMREFTEIDKTLQTIQDQLANNASK